MRRIHYGGGFVVVDDQVCKALLRYSRALAKAEKADVVIFPALTAENKVGVAHMVVGPASQLLSVPVDDLPLNLADPAMVEILEGRTRGLDPATPAWDQDVIDITDFTHFDWDL